MATIVHFDLPADDPERAKTFYSSLFGWTFEPAPGFPDYYLIKQLPMMGPQESAAVWESGGCRIKKFQTTSGYRQSTPP